jgi:hypothetical protein
MTWRGKVEKVEEVEEVKKQWQVLEVKKMKVQHAWAPLQDSLTYLIT